jgi:hypothetical protein
VLAQGSSTRSHEVVLHHRRVENIAAIFECVIASAAKQSIVVLGDKWIASSQGLLAMTGKQPYFLRNILSRALSMRSGEFETA